MFEKLARWYLIKRMKKRGTKKHELVIRDNGYAWRRRDFEREKSIETTLSIIK